MRNWLATATILSVATIAAVAFATGSYIVPRAMAGADGIRNVALDGFEPTVPPEPAPELGLMDMEGDAVSLSDLRGRVVLVNLWATWCAPCVEEMPALQALHTDLGGPDFQVAAISADRGGANQVRPFLAAHDIDMLPVYLDPEGKSMRAFAVRGLPTTILLDRQGNELGRLEGAAEWDSEDAKQLIRRAMEIEGDDGSDLVETSG